MTPAQELMKEHEVILEMLAVIQAAVGNLEHDGREMVEDFRGMVRFLREFADGCHHAKEERYLFPAMVSSGVPREHGPIAVMLSEHEIGRGYIRSMSDALDQLLAGEQKQLQRFAEHALAYTSLLTAHIAKENQVLFPMADARLSPAQVIEVLRGFDVIEKETSGAGKHEEFNRLVERLKAKYLTGNPV